ASRDQQGGDTGGTSGGNLSRKYYVVMVTFLTLAQRHALHRVRRPLRFVLSAPRLWETSGQSRRSLAPPRNRAASSIRDSCRDSCTKKSCWCGLTRRR